MKKTILLAVAAAGAFTLTASAYDGDVVMSPRAQAQAASPKYIGSMAPGVTGNLATNRPDGNAKAWALEQSLKKSPGVDNSPNLVTSNYAGAATKGGARTTGLAHGDVQVAPLK